MNNFRQQKVAIIGATGQVGMPLTKNLLALGHKVCVLTRSLSEPQITSLAELQADIIEIKDMHNIKAMINALEGYETLICAVPASISILTVSEPLWLKAATLAGIKRFVPTEFGSHTRAINWGDGVVFDRKKELHEKIFDSGIGWTFMYTGGIFDYFLPNLRFFNKITTFGNCELPIYTHHIEDIGTLSALSLTDDRTINHCVQLDFNSLTQKEMLHLIKTNFSDYEFEYEHFSSEFITQARLSATDQISAKKGSETDKERWGINYVNYVIGKLAAFTDETLRATKLYPEYQIKVSPQQALSDRSFVFDK